MKFNELKEKVSSFILTNSFVIYAVKNELFFPNCTISLKKQNARGSIINLYNYDDNFISCLYTDGSMFIIGNTQIKQLPYKCCVNEKINSNNALIFDYNYETMSPLCNIYNITTNSLSLNNWLAGRIFTSNNQYFNINDDLFSLINVKNSFLEWSFDFSTLPPYINYDGEHPAKLVSTINIYNNILWLHVEHNRLIGLAVNTGELKYQINLLEVFNLKCDATDQFLCGDIHLDAKRGVLKSLSKRYYWEMDLNTLQAAVKKDFGADESISWRIKRSRFYEGDTNLYFVGSKRGEVVTRVVGIFDTEKSEVVWYDEPLEEKKFLFFTGTPQSNGKQLGILDTEDTLRIYDF